MAYAGLGSGVKIVVDTTDIDVKFTKSVEQLNASLTKAQKSMRLTYDANGQLVDALGRCAEGLSNAQLKLGMWIDEEGRARTFEGGTEVFNVK